jgi:hypothetical protein
MTIQIQLATMFLYACFYNAGQIVVLWTFVLLAFSCSKKIHGTFCRAVRSAVQAVRPKAVQAVRNMASSEAHAAGEFTPCLSSAEISLKEMQLEIRFVKGGLLL